MYFLGHYKCAGTSFVNIKPQKKLLCAYTVRFMNLTEIQFTNARDQVTVRFYEMDDTI